MSLGIEHCEPSQQVQIRRLGVEEEERVGAVLGLSRLHQGDGRYLVAWQHGEAVGHAYLVLTDPPELQDVSVRCGYRRRGIASALTAAAGGEARAAGFDRLTLEVSTDNAAAQALYRRLGYTDSGAAPRRVCGTVMVRTGPIEVDDTLLTWEKLLAVQ